MAMFLAAAENLSVEAGQFIRFGGLHLLLLALTLALPIGLSLLVRRPARPRTARGVALSLAVVLLLGRVFAFWLFYTHFGLARWQDALPMHLCDWALFAVVIALVWRGQMAYELAYFWGLSGTAQGILTPDLAETFPSPFFFSFFIAHCGIVISVLFMTWGLRRRPRPGAVWRAWGWCQIYLACAAVVNWLAQTNYGYLAAKPQHASLLDHFGPWPWYLVVLEGVALVFFLLFYAPFWVSDRRRRSTSDAQP